MKSGLGIGGPKELVLCYYLPFMADIILPSLSTPFGLYREGTELRAVYYAYEDVGKAACGSLGTQCDYPILLGEWVSHQGTNALFTN